MKRGNRGVTTNQSTPKIPPDILSKRFSLSDLVEFMGKVKNVGCPIAYGSPMAQEPSPCFLCIDDTNFLTLVGFMPINFCPNCGRKLGDSFGKKSPEK